jgi:(p)ppGpp synthase/HD superfamily hydrolase
MRTLRSLPLDDSERLKIAEEALKVYAPLAHRMGAMKVKGELEDLAFKHLHPEVFQVMINSSHTFLYFSNSNGVFHFLTVMYFSSFPEHQI